jgi:hypothetical protein
VFLLHASRVGLDRMVNQTFDRFPFGFKVTDAVAPRPYEFSDGSFAIAALKTSMS